MFSSPAQESAREVMYGNEARGFAVDRRYSISVVFDDRV